MHAVARIWCAALSGCAGQTQAERPLPPGSEAPRAPAGKPFSETQILEASQPSAQHLYGRAVAIAGDTLVVGASWDQGGEVHIYRPARAGRWTEAARFSSAQHKAYFGIEVEAAPSLALAASTREVFVYEPAGATWQQTAVIETDTLDYINDVATDGTHIAIGVRRVMQPRIACAVYVYERIATGWQRVAHLKGAEGAEWDEFGRGVAIEGSTLLVGAPSYTGNYSRQGAVYVYERRQQSWQRTAMLLAGQPSKEEFFGNPLSLRNGRALVGAVNHGGNFAGAVYLFGRHKDGAWVEEQRLRPHDPQSGAMFGVAARFADDQTIVVGAPLASLAYVFLASGTGDFVQAQVVGVSDGGDRVGYTLGASGATLVLGGPNRTVNGMPYAGGAYVFSR